MVTGQVETIRSSRDKKARYLQTLEEKGRKKRLTLVIKEDREG